MKYVAPKIETRSEVKGLMWKGGHTHGPGCGHGGGGGYR